MTPPDRARTAALVEARLRAALADPDRAPDRGATVDLSPAAVTARLLDACELSSLCLELAGAHAGRPPG